MVKPMLGPPWAPHILAKMMMGQTYPIMLVTSSDYHRG